MDKEQKIQWESGFDWLYFFNNQGGSPAGIDIICGGAVQIEKRIGELLFVLLSCIRDESGHNIYKAINIISPPNSDKKKAFFDAFQNAAQKLGGRPLTDNEREYCKRKILFTNADSFEFDAVLSPIKNSEANTFILILDACKYRDHQVEIQRVNASLQNEDIWVPHLFSLASSCIESAQKNNTCILIDVGMFAPQKTSNIEKLKSLDPCGLFICEDQSLSFILSTESDKWITLAKAGQQEEALRLIDDLHESLDIHKPLLKIQTLHMGGLSNEATEIIRTIENLDSSLYSADVKVRLALIASKANDLYLVEKLLKLVELEVENLSIDFLESGLDICSKHSINPSLETQCFQVLDAVYPHSETLHEYKIFKLLKACKNAQSKLQYASAGKDIDLQNFSALLIELLQTPTPDYVEIVESLSSQHPQFSSISKLCCAIHALEKGIDAEAIFILNNIEQLTFNLQICATKMQLLILENFILNKNSSEGIDDETILKVVQSLINFLAKNTDTGLITGMGFIRLRLTELLSLNTSGNKGVAYLLKIFLDSLDNNNVINLEQTPHKKCSENEFNEFFKAYKNWFKKNNIFNLEFIEFPKELLTTSADALWPWIEERVNFASQHSDYKQGDESVLESFAQIACALAPHTSNKKNDLVVLKVIAQKLISIGMQQKARDYAELLLMRAGKNLERQRLAWFAFSDIYHRCRIYHEALLGIACAFSIQTPISKHQYIEEHYCTIRLFRDLGFYDFSSFYFDKLVSFVKNNGGFSLERLESIGIGLELSKFNHSDLRLEAIQNLYNLSERLALNIQSLIAINEDMLPTYSLAYQIIDLCKTYNVELSKTTKLQFTAAKYQLEKQQHPLASLFDTDSISTEQLFEQMKAKEMARYASDVPHDDALYIHTARTYLSKEIVPNNDSLIFLHEVLTEHAIDSRSSDIDDIRQNWLPPSMNEFKEIALNIASRKNCTLQLLSLNKKNELIRTTVDKEKNVSSLIEPRSIFSLDALKRWENEYPYAYGADNENANIFYTSLNGIGVSKEIVDNDRLIFISDVKLQKIPPPLYMIEGDLLGNSGVATASAPSLSWLHHDMNRSKNYINGFYAWISNAATEKAAGTLAFLATLLKETLEQYQIPLDENSAISKKLANAELVIVGAHGGITNSGGYFQQIADEGEFKSSPLNFARSIQNAGVVILFVCNAGRLDHHQTANTTISLPKELLNNGCSAVVASSWPLDIQVAARWLPTFLEAWNAGDMIIDANKKANDSIKLSGYEPKDYLAMNIYGNPFIKKLQP